MNCQRSYISYINKHPKKIVDLKTGVFKNFFLKIHRSQTDYIYSYAEISKGKVFFAQNPHLCYVNTIEWTAIVPGREQPVRYGEMAFSEQCKCLSY